MKNLTKAVLLSFFGLATTETLQAGYLNNYNDPNIERLKSAVQNRNINVIQFGDSHTAADTLTEVLRNQLQSSLGNGGMGWAMPMFFTGQRLARFGYDNNGWQPISSRTQHSGNYTIGGLNAVPRFSGATLTIKAKLSEQPQSIIASIRQAPSDGNFSGVDATGKSFTLEAPQKNNRWQTVRFNATLPFTITAQNANNSAIGGWWARNQNGQGAVVSAIGINGAELSNWNRWSSDWQQELSTVAPDLVILAYGTNEAYNDNLNVEQTRNTLVEKIQDIRRAAPQTAIMIISAPESLKSTAGSCGRRPVKLDAVQQMQQDVAQSMHTLHWDWQQAMGGNCSMKSWINQGLGRADGVHFSANGYNKIGQMLANDLLNIAGVKPSSSAPSNTTSPATFIKSDYNNYGYAQICLEGNTECKSIGR